MKIKRGDKKALSGIHTRVHGKSNLLLLLKEMVMKINVLNCFLLV